MAQHRRFRNITSPLRDALRTVDDSLVDRGVVHDTDVPPPPEPARLDATPDYLHVSDALLQRHLPWVLDDTVLDAHRPSPTTADTADRPRSTPGVSAWVGTHGAVYSSSTHRWREDTVHPESFALHVSIDAEHLTDGESAAYEISWTLGDGAGQESSGVTTLPTRTVGGDLNSEFEPHHPDEPGEPYHKPGQVPDSLTTTIPIGSLTLRLQNPGPYTVRLVPLLGEQGGFTRPGDPLTLHGRLDHALVCLMGDSIAAGQGLPDEFGDPAAYEPISATTLYYMTDRQPDGEAPTWQEPLSWRSERSGMTQAAFRLRSPERSVTFVSVASSGAGISDGLLLKQSGRDHLFGGQIDELEALLEHGGVRRRPDVLMVSIGANDVVFSDALEDLAKNDDEDSWWNLFAWLSVAGAFLAFADLLTSGRSQEEVLADLDRELEERFRPKLDLLADRIADLDPRTVLVTEYPVAMFDRADGTPGPGCGLFSTPTLNAGLSTAEATMIEEAGQRLNDMLRSWCDDHPRYRFVDGIARAFSGHGYCSGQSYWTGAEQSLRQQLDGDGVLHPNEDGYAAIADIVAEALTDVLE